MKLCVHCGKNKINRPRNLCWGCYYAPGVREQYASLHKFPMGYDEPSEEEVKAMLEEAKAKGWIRKRDSNE